MKKILFITLTTFITFIINAQSVQVAENFDNTVFAPTGWKLNPAATGPQSAWSRRILGTFPSCLPYLGAGMARFSSRGFPGGYTQQLISPAVNYINRNTSVATVSLWMYRGDSSVNYDSLCVWVNNTDSIDANAIKLGTITQNRTYMFPDTQAVNGWYHYTFNVPTTFTNNTTTHFIFQGVSDNVNAPNTGANIYIDEINYDEYPTPCTGTPNVGSIVKNKNIICGGSGTVNLSLTAPITNVAGLNYFWMQSNTLAGPYTQFGTNAATATSPIISTTTYFKCYVSCTASSMNYVTNIDSITVSTNPVPTISVTPSPAVFCAGSVGATITASGASTYSWTPTTGLSVSTGVTTIATPTVNTQYVVAGTDANGCYATTFVNVNVANGPVLVMSAMPSDTVCIGNRVTLNCFQGGPGGNGNQYSWSNGQITRRDTFTVTNSVMMYVNVTNAAGCTSRDSIKVIAKPTQNSNFGYTQSSNTFNFIDSTIGGTNWTWFFGDGNSSSNQNPVYTYSATGTYTVTLVVRGACKTDTVTKVIHLWATAINNYNVNTKAVCYPNPTTDIYNISVDDNIINAVKINNILGQKVQENIFSNASNTVSFSVKDLPNGVYNVQVTTSKGLIPMKLIKQ